MRLFHNAQRLFRERRNTPRRQQSVRVLFMTNDCVMGEPYPGTLVDSSRGGLRLSVPCQQIEEGSFLHIRHPRAWDGVPWLPVRVMNRRQINGTWELGCQVVQELENVC